MVVIAMAKPKKRRRHLSKGFLGLKVGYQIKAQKEVLSDISFEDLDFVMSGKCMSRRAKTRKVSAQCVS